MGLKAPGNYLEQFWSNQILASLLERLKPPNSMNSGFLTPGKPLFIDFIISNYFKTCKKHDGNIFEKYVLLIWTSKMLKRLEGLCT